MFYGMLTHLQSPVYNVYIRTLLLHVGAYMYAYTVVDALIRGLMSVRLFPDNTAIVRGKRSYVSTAISEMQAARNVYL